MKFRRFFKIVLCLMLTASFLLAAVSCNKNNTEREKVSGVGKNAVSSRTADPNFTPNFRVVAIGDVFATANSNDTGLSRVAQALQAAYSYAASSSYKAVDAVVFTGNFTASGSEQEYKAFMKVLDANLREGTVALFCLGEREFDDPGEGTVYCKDTLLSYARFEKYTSMKADSLTNVNGYSFVGISGDDKGGSAYTAEKAEVLEDLLYEANTDKPVFVFQNVPVKDTVGGSGNGTETFNEILSYYPQVIDLSGNTLFPTDDARSIMQTDFTSISVGNLCYRLTELTGVDGAGRVYYKDDVGSYADASKYVPKESEYNAADLRILEMDSDYRLRVQTHNLLSGDMIGSPIIVDSVADKKNFNFTAQRAKTSKGCAFAEGATVTVESATASSLKITLPIASGEYGVQYYKCDLLLDEEPVKTANRLANNIMLPQTSATTVYFSGLTKNTDYTLQVYAVDYFGEPGDPLITTVSTGSTGGEGGSLDDDPTAPDVFSLSLSETGEAYDAVSGDLLEAHGTPAVTTMGGHVVADFDGSGSYWTYDGFSDYWTTEHNTVTFELVMKTDKLKYGTYINPASDQSMGGFGYEISTGGKLQFWCAFGDYVVLECSIPKGEFVHLTATCNGAKLSLYLNGVLQTEQNISGNITPPTDSTIWFFTVGGDSAGDKEPQGTGLKGQIAAANIWSYALDETTIAARAATVASIVSSQNTPD